MKNEEYYKGLMKKSLKGDNLAYKELLTQLTTDIKSFLKKRISDIESTDDITQEILLSIHKSRHTYDHKRLFGPWLYSIVRYRLTDYYRSSYKIKKNEKHIEADQFEQLESPQATCTVELGEVIKMMEMLPDKQKDLIKQTKFIGLSIKEVSNKLNINESAAKVGIHRGLNSLKEMLRGK